MTYLKFISKAFQRSIAYKLEYYTGLMNAFLYIFIFTSVWQTVAKESPGALGTWSGETLVSYAILSTLIKVSFGRNESLLTNKIKTGDIVYDILKPYNFVMMYFADSFGVSLFQLFARAIPLLIFSLLFFGIVPSVTTISLLQFIPVYFMSFLLFILFGFMISSLAFFFTEVFSFMILYSALVTLMSGSVIPLNLFPDFLVKIISWSPFPYLYYYPTTVLIGTPIQMTYEELLLRYFLELTIVGSITFSIYFSGKKKLEFAGG
ncbi:MAG: ABC-2 family transporter protein [Leptospiraceae bacterium]|nr:ABC-2 family transporter protein [Leptospiraceae bacterium]